jgi:hypothetical protein
MVPEVKKLRKRRDLSEALNSSRSTHPIVLKPQNLEHLLVKEVRKPEVAHLEEAYPYGSTSTPDLAAEEESGRTRGLA